MCHSQIVPFPLKVDLIWITPIMVKSPLKLNNKISSDLVVSCISIVLIQFTYFRSSPGRDFYFSHILSQKYTGSIYEYGNILFIRDCRVVAIDNSFCQRKSIFYIVVHIMNTDMALLAFYQAKKLKLKNESNILIHLKVSFIYCILPNKCHIKSDDKIWKS